ncbi:MAG: PAS domain-containing sensor histidine kinase [Pseudodesulfovibrio sp.]
MSSYIQERFLYEIAMSIGNSLDIEVMLKEGLSTYLRKLNCLAGAVLKRVEDDAGNSSFQLVYAIPKRMKRNAAVSEGIELLPSELDQEALAAYLAKLPEKQLADGYRRYTMELPGFGLLLLVKSAPGFSIPELKSLAPLNIKLAGACISCTANERLQSEIEVRLQAENKYRDIFDNAIEGVYQTAMEGQILEVNPAMARLLGFDSPDALMASDITFSEQIYVRPEDRERLLRRLKRTGRVAGFEFEYHRKDGSQGWMSISARLIRDKEGNPLYIEGLADDITPRKQAVIALREAKQEAERLSQMKSSFLSMVSHELRTPLTAILGFAKISRKRLGEIPEVCPACAPAAHKVLGRIEQNVEVIIAEGERLTELINNVLDLSKLEAGWFEWSESDVSMNGVLEHSLAATGILFSEPNVMLLHSVDADLPLVSGDRDRLIQVVINLISNAAKFTVEGTVSLCAAVEGNNIVVKVYDTGIGVSDSDVEVMFDKFRQLGNTLTDKPKGTGLGLPICKEIIEHHRGKIWFEPNPDGGSVFAFTVPIK